ncbi:M16 family metallopeptidase [Nocardia sp. NPDC060256]|uniref:M16 family metallopeptidase n=1 Tax=unclassified Nocardia TaxID=2637762 RepID=UPI00365C9BCE
MEIEHLDVHGARAALVWEPDVPIVSTSIRIAAGSRDDPAARHGLAHVLEHTMFAGSDSRGRGEFGRLIETAGGVVNANTLADWTTYWHVVPAESFPLVLKSETARFAAACDRFTEDSVGADAQIVLRERHQRVSSPVYGDAAERLLAAVHPVGSPYRHLPVGDPEHVGRVGAADCRAFFERNYVSENVFAVILGRFDRAAARTETAELLGMFGSGTARAPIPDDRRMTTVRVVVATESRDRVFLGVPLAPMNERGFELAEIGSIVLGRGPSSILARLLVQESALAESVSLRVIPHQWCGSLGIVELAPRPGVGVEQIIDGFDAAMDSVVRRGVAADDIGRARAVYLSSWLAEDDSLLHRADGLTLSMQIHGGIDRYLEQSGRIEAMTADDFQRAARLWNSPRARAEVVYVR